MEKKIYSIEQIDKVVVKTVVEGLKARGEDFAILIAPDHPTPIATKTHCSDPVPYLLYKSYEEKSGAQSYDEQTAENSGVFVEQGHQLIKKLIAK